MTRIPTRYGLVINPTAGHGRGRRRRAEVIEGLHRLGLDFLDLSQPSAALAFAYAVERKHDYDALIVVGGDGMVHLGLNLVAGTSKPLGVVPLGSGNDFARHLGLPIHNVNESLDIITASHTRKVDAMRLTRPGDRSWAHPTYPHPWRWAGCVVSAGFDSMVNSRANTYAWPRGHGRYVRGILRELSTFSSYPYMLEIDQTQRTFNGTLVAVANTPTFGGGLKVAPAARIDSGKLDVVVAKELSKMGLLRVFPRLYSGTHIDHPVVSIQAGRRITIAPQQPGTIPEIFADGELVGQAPVQIEVVAGAVEMLCPRLEV